MVTGIFGTGKTVLGVQFLTSAVLTGRRALLVTLDEHPRQLIRNAKSLGFDLEGLIKQGSLFIHYESPLELELDVHFDTPTAIPATGQLPDLGSIYTESSITSGETA